MASTWITIECRDPACKWVWAGYASAGRAAWAAHNAITHGIRVKTSCKHCSEDAFEFCRECGGDVEPRMAIEPFCVCSYESSTLAGILERAVMARRGAAVPNERAVGRRGAYEGAFLCNGIVQSGRVHRIVCMLDLLAPAPAWVLRVALAAAPMGTPITPLLSRPLATKLALDTGFFTPSGGRCVLSLRAAVEIGSVDPEAIVAATTTWKSQYLQCAVAACTRKRRSIAAALAGMPQAAKHRVMTTLVADCAKHEIISFAVSCGFPVTEETLWLALRAVPINFETLGLLLKTTGAIGELSISAAAAAAAHDPAGLSALQAVLSAGGGVVARKTGAPDAMRVAVMRGDSEMLSLLVAEGGKLLPVTPGDNDGIRAVVGAACKLRGHSRVAALEMLVGKLERKTELLLRAQDWKPADLAQWACIMLGDADGLGARMFARWVGPFLDKCPSWNNSVWQATITFAKLDRPDEYLAIATAYGTPGEACPLAAMSGLFESDADTAIQWLIDCRPGALRASSLKPCAQWSAAAALAIDATTRGQPLRPGWWKRLLVLVLLCSAKRLPPELARHICTFVLSPTANAPITKEGVARADNASGVARGGTVDNACGGVLDSC